MKMLKLHVIAVVLLCAQHASAELKPAALFSDHAVLQAGVELRVWGSADAGRDVQVRIGAAVAETQASADGTWSVKLPAMRVSATPVAMTITAGDETKVIRDVLIGEVWLGSGQSNMTMALTRTNDAERLIAAADHPQMRLFTVPRLAATQPVSDVDGQWVVCSPDAVKAFSAVLYHFGRSLNEKLDQPVGLIHSSWGGTPIQAWMPREAFSGGDEQIAAQRERIRSRYPSTTLPATTRGARRAEHLEPTRLFNGMIAPLIPYPIRGVLWYQGESNVHQGDVSDYADMMNAMVRSWRSQWGQGEWPLLFVQLAPYGNYRAPADALPEMWEQQSAALKLISNSGMAVTMDLGDAMDIHPREKRIVGERLAALALARTYGQRGDCDPPAISAFGREGAKVRVRFAGSTGGLVTTDAKPPTGFELAGGDGVFVAADARIEGDDVIVWSDRVDRPMKLRYAWSATPEVNLVNRAGLPAVPFRVDVK